MVELWQFSLAELLPGKKRKSFPFLEGYAIVIGHESSSFWSSGSILIEGDLFNNFTFPSFDQGLSQKQQGSRVWFYGFKSFCPSMPGRTIPRYSVSHVEGERHRLVTYWGHIQVTMRGRKENSQALSICYQNHRHWRSSKILCHHQRFSRQTSNRHGLNDLGKLSHQILFASIRGKLYF